MHLLKVIFAVFVTLLTGCNAQTATFNMSLTHLNDIHSYPAPVSVTTKIDGVNLPARRAGHLKAILAAWGISLVHDGTEYIS
jgi:hypothetical protein